MKKMLMCFVAILSLAYAQQTQQISQTDGVVQVNVTAPASVGPNELMTVDFVIQQPHIY